MTTKHLMLAGFSLFLIGVTVAPVQAGESALLEALISPSSSRSLTDKPLSPASDVRTTQAFIAKAAPAPVVKKVASTKENSAKAKKTKTEARSSKTTKTASSKTKAKSHKAFTEASAVIKKKKSAATASP